MNEACYTWGTHVEAELKQATKDAEDDKSADRKVQLAWRRLFGDEDAELAQQGQFRDPMSMLGKK